MKMMKKIVVLLGCVMLLSGCTKSNIIQGGADYGDLPAPSSEGIVWEQLWEDFHEIYEDKDTYPFAGTVSGSVDPEKKEASFFLLLNEGISKEEAAEYATTVLKGFNDLISTQNSAYGASSEESYGGYLSSYKIYVMVAETDYMNTEEKWILEDEIPAGTYRAVDPNAVPKAKAEAEAAGETETETAAQ